jgi:pyruvate/2-oxoglutarate/acetoin dehydrogenase E1 component
VTRNLSTDFPNRVITTPVSEAGIVGVGIGMAMRGFLPVIEIMFGDFLALAADQILNHAAKFRWISGGEVQVPLVIRTPMGGRRGYGPTHSQTLEKHFLGIPGLRTLAINTLGDPGDVLEAAVLHDEEPVLLIENKALYAENLKRGTTQSEFQVQSHGKAYPEHHVLIKGAPEPVITLVAYGYMAEVAGQSMLNLAYEHEIFTELIVPTQISPFNIESIRAHSQDTGRLLVLEEGTLTLGYGAEVLARVLDDGSTSIHCGRLAAVDMPVPAAGPLESRMIPQVENVIDAAYRLIERS